MSLSVEHSAMSDRAARSSVAAITAWSGIGSALILTLNAAKRADLVPAVPAVQLLAPLAEVLAVLFVTGLYLRSGRGARAWGAAAYAANVASLALLVGAEWVINLVLAGRPDAGSFVVGPLKTAFTLTSILFLIASIAFAAVIWTDREVPRWAVVTYAVGASVVALRAFIPEIALQVGLVVLAIGITGLAGWLLRSSTSSSRPAQAD